MAVERTLAIIKPDAVSRKLIGNVVQRYEDNGFDILAMEMIHMDDELAEGFYAVHKERPFFNDLVSFMTSGPCVILVLEAENAVSSLRKLMGATNPEEAEEGTIRKDLATDIEKNVVHGSDSPENAKIEIKYFFGAKMAV